MPEFTNSEVAIIRRRSVRARREPDATEQCDALNAFRQPGSCISTTAGDVARIDGRAAALSVPIRSRSMRTGFGRRNFYTRSRTWMAFAIPPVFDMAFRCRLRMDRAVFPDYKGRIIKSLSRCSIHGVQLGCRFGEIT